MAEPDDHALGRCRVGLTTKIHALTDTATCPVAMSITAGQAHDNPALLPLVDGYFAAEATTDVPRDVRLLGRQGVLASLHPYRTAQARDPPHDPRA